MNALSTHAGQTHALEHLHAAFLTLVPRIETHGRIYFRHLRCAHRREEALAEMTALCWKWFLRLTERGKDADRFAAALVGFAARAVRSGRRACGQERAKDVMSPLAQARHDFVVEHLPEGSTLGGNAYDEALADNTQTPVPEQAAFRADFPRWRDSFSDRDREIMDRLMMGERTQDVAREFGISPARVSQLRREFMTSWDQFGDEVCDPVAVECPA